jgi:transketolase
MLAPDPPMTAANSLAQDIRRLVIERSKAAHVGHIGSCLCVADILAVLYGEVLEGQGPDDPDRDRFVLSKGHAALALYAALARTGRLPEETLEGFGTDGSELAVHPEAVLPGVDFATGSLGHGLTYAGGAALAAKLDGSSRRTFVLLSDAECNSGALWESVMFAAHHQLSSLVAIVDLNGQQALGATSDILDLDPLGDRFAAFGWDVGEVDGHDTGALLDTITSLDTAHGPPHVILARTKFGKGVSYMEGELSWHYWPMSDEQYAQATAELQAADR